MNSNYNVVQLSTNREMWKVIIFSFLTFGIYGIVFYTCLGTDINTLASRRDHKNTMHYCLVFFLLGPITSGIFSVIWFHMLSERIGEEARARGINTDFGASTFWLWNVLGSFIFVGPFIYIHKLCKTMNAICMHHNTTGI